MGLKYAVLGAGRQGMAAAYDLARFGNAEHVLLADANLQAAQKCAERINFLLHEDPCSAMRVDVGDTKQVMEALQGTTAIVSAVPYRFNLALTEAAINIGCNMVDLGGNTDIVQKQKGLDSDARNRGVTIVPDCGMGPGMNVSLAVYAMSLLDVPREVYIWDGGLPQKPKPPWNYELTFNIGGLINEYYGNAHFLRDGNIVEVPCFEGREEIEFPQPIGTLEAFVTSGGLSTMPWTFANKLQKLENKTLRYPGHWAQFSAFARLGFFEPEPVQIRDNKIAPRDMLSALLEPQITSHDTRDVCIIRVRCVGEKDKKPTGVTVELMDYYDEKTGFTAMQRLTGWHASIIAIMTATKSLPKGVVSVENVSGAAVVIESEKRGLKINTDISAL
jgi:lysine 6-dehydrogenase